MHIMTKTDEAVVALRTAFLEMEDVGSQHKDKENFGTSVALGKWLELEDHIQLESSDYTCALPRLGTSDVFPVPFLFLPSPN